MNSVRYRENNVGNTARRIEAALGLRYSDGALYCPELKSRGPIREISEGYALELARDSARVLEKQRQRRAEILKMRGNH